MSIRSRVGRLERDRGRTCRCCGAPINGAGCYDPGSEAEGAREILMEKLALIAQRRRQSGQPEGDPPPAT